MTNKTWLIDFDGVVNATAKRPDPASPLSWRDTTLQGWDDIAYPVLYAQEVIDLIILAIDQGGIDIVWLSTWAEETKQFPLAMPGMPILPFIGSQADIHNVSYEDKTHWKLDAAKAYVPDDHDLMWTEDERYLTKVIAYDWLIDRSGPSWVINPIPDIGLSKRNMADIRDWIMS